MSAGREVLDDDVALRDQSLAEVDRAGRTEVQVTLLFP